LQYIGKEDMGTGKLPPDYLSVKGGFGEIKTPPESGEKLLELRKDKQKGKKAPISVAVWKASERCHRVSTGRHASD
jgi:hypothetical protein